MVPELADAMSSGRLVTLTDIAPLDHTVGRRGELMAIPGDPAPVRDVYHGALGCP
jgi:hypothetical protein